MDYATIATIVTLLLALAASAFGVKYQLGKGKLEKISGLLGDVVDAAKDDEVTEKEFQLIVDDAKEILEGS